MKNMKNKKKILQWSAILLSLIMAFSLSFVFAEETETTETTEAAAETTENTGNTTNQDGEAPQDCEQYNELSEELKEAWLKNDGNYIYCDYGSDIPIDVNTRGGDIGNYTWPGLEWIVPGETISTEKMKSAFGFLRGSDIVLKNKIDNDYKKANAEIVKKVENIDQLRAQLGPQCEFKVNQVDCNKEFSFPCNCSKTGCQLCYEEGKNNGSAQQLEISCKTVNDFDLEHPEDTGSDNVTTVYGPVGNCEFKNGAETVSKAKTEAIESLKKDIQ